MALQITGKIEKIGATNNITTKTGSVFEKRELLLDATTYDRYTGEPRENHISIEFSHNKCSILDSFKVSDRVTVSFVLQGSNYVDKETGAQKNYTRIVGYDCVGIAQKEQVQTVQEQQAPVVQQASVQESKTEQLPF